MIVATADVGEHFVVVDGAHAPVDVLAHAAMRALLGRRGEEHLDRGLGKHHCADVAALHHVVARAPDALLLLQRALRARQGTADTGLTARSISDVRMASSSHRRLRW